MIRCCKAVLLKGMRLIRPPLLACATSVGFSLAVLSAAQADQADPRLDDIFQQLRKADNSTQSLPLEQQIWRIWLEHPDPQISSLMQTGINQLNSNAMSAALATFTRITQLAPDYAEGWNKRATVYYLMGNYSESEADIKQTLVLEPFHFGALSGLGLVCMAQREFLRARGAFHAALEVYPHMAGVQINLQALDEFLRAGAI